MHTLILLLALVAGATDINRSLQVPDKELGKNPERGSTSHIIIHNTEVSFSASVMQLTGKRLAHYLIDRDGTVYSIVPRKRFANHAGKSMWRNQRKVSEVSLGIELVGTYQEPLTDEQYASLKSLVHELQGIYKLPDSSVLGHYQVAANTNRWSPKLPLRGRRYDGSNIDWARIGIEHDDYDPDFEAGRVGYDVHFKKYMNELRSRRLLASRS